MLAPNPVDRLRSMDEVIAMLDAAPAPTAAIPAPPTPAPASHKAPAPKAAPVAASGESAAKRTGPPLPLIIGGAAVAVLLAAGGGAFLLMGKSSPTPASLTVAGAPTVSAGAAAPAETVRRAIETALAQVPCSWLDIDSVSPTGGGVAVALTGVAGSTQAANSAIAAAARSVGVAIPDVNLANVLPADPKVCAALDAFRPFRADTSANGRRLSTSQTKYTLEKQPDGSLSQKAVVTMAIGDPSLDFSLFGIEPTGKIDGPLVPSRAVFMAALKDPENKEKLNDMGGDTYRLSIGMSPPVGLQGVLLLTGADLDAKLVGKAPAARGAGWAQQIAAAARRGGWKAEMVWYRLVDPTSS
jgi:serine/threonine-protein kinase